jgi:hypothetical protein
MRKCVIAPIARCAVAVCASGHASASPHDDSFVVALHDDGVVVPLSVDPIMAAQGACMDLKKGQPFEAIAATERAAGVTDPAAFVDLAIEYYCPQCNAR